ncbi:protein obstructor-E-like [Onthophagus taurus]|uniref:protein obstructor-E-like n=1 Tax=Onthophagus taurus TaxID=166361 RepID=UPI0039BE7070
MKYSIIFLVALLATCYADMTCPNPEETPTYYADPESCRYFYECSNGEAEKLDCGECLVFNEAENVCDFPSNVERCNSQADCDPDPEETVGFIELQ